MNSSPDEDAAVAALMQSRTSEIPDDGFSARVLAALPPGPRRRGAGAWGWLVYPLSGCAGAVLAVWLAGRQLDHAGAAQSLANALDPLGEAMLDPWFSVALTIALLSLGIAYVSFRPWRQW